MIRKMVSKNKYGGVKRECIKAIRYTYETSKGQKFKRIVLCELEEVKKCEIGKKNDTCCCYKCVIIRDYFENKRVFVEK
jgi:hypothetical protein